MNEEKMIIDQLHTQFGSGKTPTHIDGFYQGALLAGIPGNTTERIWLGLLTIWLPWKGKWFDERRQHGDNIVPSLAAALIRPYFGSAVIREKGYGGHHAFPFRTTIEKGIYDPIDVMKLDYDLPENPVLVRNVVDEAVELSDGTLLGKAYRKEGKEYRLVAFFRLIQ